MYVPERLFFSPILFFRLSHWDHKNVFKLALGCGTRCRCIYTYVCVCARVSRFKGGECMDGNMFYGRERERNCNSQTDALATTVARCSMHIHICTRLEVILRKKFLLHIQCTRETISAKKDSAQRRAKMHFLKSASCSSSSSTAVIDSFFLLYVFNPIFLSLVFLRRCNKPCLQSHSMHRSQLGDRRIGGRAEQNTHKAQASAAAAASA